MLKLLCVGVSYSWLVPFPMQLLLHCIFQRDLDFWGTFVGRCLYSLLSQFIFASVTKAVSGCLQQCLWLPCSLLRGSLNSHTYWDFSLFTQMFFASQFEINFLWCWSFVWFWCFLYPCFDKTFKKSNKYLQLYTVNALRMAVNLSLKAVYKTAETHWWCCQDNEN